MTKFQDLGLSDDVLKGISEQGFDEAFPLKESAQFIKPFEPLAISHSLHEPQELVSGNLFDDLSENTKSSDKN